MTNLTDIRSKDWTFSADVQGEVVEQLKDIQQCIYLILTTVPGTDPLRPDFGCDIFKWIDRPVNQAIPNMIKEVQVSIAKWEPRAVVKGINAKIDGHVVTLTITFETVASRQIETIQVKYGAE